MTQKPPLTPAGMFGPRRPTIIEEAVNALSSYADLRKSSAWAKLPWHPTLPGCKIDCDGLGIAWDEYGKTTAFGWEIDHIDPTALGGSDNFSNLRARHWKGNRSAGGRLGNALASASPTASSSNSLLGSGPFVPGPYSTTRKSL